MIVTPLIPIKKMGTPFRSDQSGAVLMELIVAIILMGVVLPSVFSLIASVSIHSVQNGLRDQAVSLASAKLEEIIGRKEANWDWYKDTNQYESDENLADGFHRVVQINQIQNWGAGSLSAWEVSVNVSHPQLPEGFSLSVRLTVYAEQ